MQPIYLASIGKFNLTQHIKYEFDGLCFRVYMNNKLVHTEKAVAGEVFFIQLHGFKKAPDIIPATLPTEKGQKMAWALSFVKEETRTNSKSEFLEKLYEFQETYSDTKKIISIEKGKYAFAFLQLQNKKKLKPILSYISNNIDYNELTQLIQDFSEFREIYCSKAFLYVL